MSNEDRSGESRSSAFFKANPITSRGDVLRRQDDGKKKPLQSRTVQANLAKAAIPFLAFFLARHLEADVETAFALAAVLYGVLESIAQIALRRAVGW